MKLAYRQTKYRTYLNVFKTYLEVFKTQHFKFTEIANNYNLCRCLNCRLQMKSLPSSQLVHILWASPALGISVFDFVSPLAKSVA